MATLTNRWYADQKIQFIAGTLDLQDVAIQALDPDAVFNPTHTDWEQAVGSQGEVLQSIDVSQTRTINADLTILDVSDFEIRGIQPNKYIGAFVLFNKQTNEPIVYLGDMPGLPHRTQYERIFVSFSNGIHKASSIQSGSLETFPAIYIQITDIKFEDLPGITRPIVEVPVGIRKIPGQKQRYKDIQKLGQAHPLTGDLTRVFDLQSIIQSMQNLINTDFNELPFGNTIGGNVRQTLFELGSSTTESDVEEQIINCLDNEPRITVEDITVEYHPDENGILITINYYVNGMTTRQEYKQFLERV